MSLEFLAWNSPPLDFSRIAVKVILISITIIIIIIITVIMIINNNNNSSNNIIIVLIININGININITSIN